MTTRPAQKRKLVEFGRWGHWWPWRRGALSSAASWARCGSLVHRITNIELRALGAWYLQLKHPTSRCARCFPAGGANHANVMTSQHGSNLIQDPSFHIFRATLYLGILGILEKE